MPAPKYTDDQFDRMADLRERGWTEAAIAAETGMRPSAVAYHCLRLGVEPPKARPLPPVPDEPVSALRGGHVVRRFTKAEDAQIVAMDLAGETLSEIARALGRRHNSIKGRLMTLARRDERTAS